MILFKTNLQRYGTLSTLVFLITILNAFRQRSNFYSAAVYLSKSNACMMILWNQAIFQTLLFGRFLQHIFFGTLRPLEVERLQERGWFAVTETLLALTIFRDEFDTTFIVLFISLLFLKVFHWLAQDRIELMEQSTSISRLFHYRMVTLLSVLWVVNSCFLMYAGKSILVDGPTVMIMFASEYMILVANVWSMTMKYGVNLIDLRSEEVWEEKSMYVFYIDLATDFFKLVTYVAFFGLILTFYGLPLNILRDVYITLRSFILKCRDLKRYRQATKNMNDLYPDATGEEMSIMVDKTCIICREDMEYRGVPIIPTTPLPAETVAAPVPVAPITPRTGPNDTPKKLPCGHVFHFHCLRSWLERQQSCPTCRRPVLPSEQITPAVRPPVVAAVDGGDRLAEGVDPVWQARVNLARNLGREAFGVVFPGAEFPPAAEAPAPVLPPVPPPAPTPALPPVANAPVNAPVNGFAPPPLAAPPSAATTPILQNLSTSIATSRSSGTENPLAQFSLPSLRLPPAGETGLYTSPGAGSGYAGIAYGAFHGSANANLNVGGMGGVGQPTLRPIGHHAANGAQKVLNLEERLALLRGRSSPAVSNPVPVVNPVVEETPIIVNLLKQLTAHQTKMVELQKVILVDRSKLIGLNPDTALASGVTRMVANTAIQVNCIALKEARKELEILDKKLKVEMEKVQLITDGLLVDLYSEEGTEVVEGGFKQAAMEAAERRAIASRVSTVRTESIGGIGSRSISASTTPLATPPILSPSNPSSASRFPTRLEETNLPRLIPLFNPSNPHATTLYPHLLGRLPSLEHRVPPSSHPRSFNSIPLFTPTDSNVKENTNENESEVEGLTRTILETKLRTVLKYQEEMEKLAKSMKKEFSGAIEPNTETVMNEQDEEKKEIVDLKGKGRMD